MKWVYYLLLPLKVFCALAKETNFGIYFVNCLICMLTSSTSGKMAAIFVV